MMNGTESDSVSQPQALFCCCGEYSTVDWAWLAEHQLWCAGAIGFQITHNTWENFLTLRQRMFAVALAARTN